MEARAAPGGKLPIRWGESPSGGRAGQIVRQLVDRVRATFGSSPRAAHVTLGSLPVALRRGKLAEAYLAASGAADHTTAGASATAAAESAMALRAWWPADIWAHRAMWHFEQAGLELDATRGARLIGEIRLAGGDPASARRYYAEAISEARDIGAEREEGLAALGMGRAEMELGDVTTARRLAQIAVDLLERAEAPQDELVAARELRGEEKEV
jgi:tetratricopeptide (TPR) repeat protein